MPRVGPRISGVVEGLCRFEADDCLLPHWAEPFWRFACRAVVGQRVLAWRTGFWGALRLRGAAGSVDLEDPRETDLRVAAICGAGIRPVFERDAGTDRYPVAVTDALANGTLGYRGAQHDLARRLEPEGVAYVALHRTVEPYELDAAIRSEFELVAWWVTDDDDGDVQVDDPPRRWRQAWVVASRPRGG